MQTGSPQIIQNLSLFRCANTIYRSKLNDNPVFYDKIRNKGSYVFISVPNIKRLLTGKFQTCMSKLQRHGVFVNLLVEPMANRIQNRHGTPVDLKRYIVQARVIFPISAFICVHLW